MTEINPFPILIFKEKFHSFNALHLEAAKEILERTVHRGNSHLEKGDAYSSISNQFNAPHQHPCFSEFFHWLINRAEHVIFDHYHLSNKYNYHVGNSWINLHRFDGQTLEHNHGLSPISCVAYLSIPTDSGYIEFKDPHYHLRSLHEQDDRYYKSWFSVTVEPGDVLFFPGWMSHRTQPNKSVEDRWILSANILNFQFIDSIKVGDVLKLL